MVNENQAGHLINGKSDGEEVGSHLALFPPVLLHQRHHEGAAHLVVLGVIILLQQTKAVLRVGPESVCKTFRRYLRHLGSHQNLLLGHTEPIQALLFVGLQTCEKGLLC